MSLVNCQCLSRVHCHIDCLIWSTNPEQGHSQTHTTTQIGQLALKDSTMQKTRQSWTNVNFTFISLNIFFASQMLTLRYFFPNSYKPLSASYIYTPAELCCSHSGRTDPNCCGRRLLAHPSAILYFVMLPVAAPDKQSYKKIHTGWFLFTGPHPKLQYSTEKFI